MSGDKIYYIDIINIFYILWIIKINEEKNVSNGIDILF